MSPARPAKIGWFGDEPRNRLATGLLIVVLVGTPLPFGSADNQWLALWVFILAVAGLLAGVGGLSRRRTLVLAPAVAGSALYGAVCLLQLTGLSGLADPVWAEAGAALQEKLAPHLTVALDAPWSALGRPLAFVLAFYAAFVLAGSLDRARTIVRVIAYACTAYAVFGILAFIFFPETLLWTTKTSYLNVLTGPFVNRNTAATYFGSGGVICVLLCLEAFLAPRGRKGQAGYSVQEAVRGGLPAGVAVYGGCFLVCLAATFMTASRAGIILTLLATFAAVMLLLMRTFPGSARWWVPSLAMAAVLIVLGQVWGGGVSLRLDSLAFFGDERWTVYQGLAAAISDRPLLGSGLGTFSDVFPRYRPPELDMRIYWDLAHSTPLEIALEMGLPVLLMIGGIFAFYLAWLALGTFERSRGVLFPIAGLCVMLLGVVHSAFDFSLQISGYAVTYAAVAGVALSQARREPDGPPARPVATPA